MRLLIGACTAYNKNTATENMNHCSILLPMGVAMNGTCIYISNTESTRGCKWG